MTLDALAREFIIRPELMSSFPPTLILNYMRLTPESKRELDEFDEEYPEYMDGYDADVLSELVIENKKEQYLARDIARYCRLTNKMVSAFDKYTLRCRTGENFWTYLKKRKSCYGCWRVYNEARKLKGGISFIMSLAAEERVELQKYNRCTK